MHLHQGGKRKGKQTKNTVITYFHGFKNQIGGSRFWSDSINWTGKCLEQLNWWFDQWIRWTRRFGGNRPVQFFFSLSPFPFGGTPTPLTKPSRARKTLFALLKPPFPGNPTGTAFCPHPALEKSLQAWPPPLLQGHHYDPAITPPPPTHVRWKSSFCPSEPPLAPPHVGKALVSMTPTPATPL